MNLRPRWCRYGRATKRRSRWMRGALLAASAVAACYGGAPAHETELSDLPLVEYPAPRGGERLAVFISGDGGWAPLDRAVTDELVARGIPVVGLLAPRYFGRTPKSAQQTADDVARIAEHYLGRWNRTGFVLIGYSRGADAAALVAGRLPRDLRTRLALVALLSPGLRADLSFVPTDLLFDRQPADAPELLPELRRLSPLPILCVYGERERHSVCPLLDQDNVEVVRAPGGHRYTPDVYGRLGHLISIATP